MAAQLDHSAPSTSLTRLSATQHQQLAEQKKQQGEFQEAIEHYRQVIELGKTGESQPMIKQENEVKAATVSPNLTTTIPKVAQIYLQQAEAFYEQGKCLQAIKACQDALAIVPQLVDAYKLWGNALLKQGQPIEAMGYYAKMLELEPDSAIARVNLGTVYAKQQKWQEALQYYQEALELDSQCASAHRNLARVWEKLGQSQEALKYRYQGVNLEPEKVSAQDHLQLGEDLWQQGWTTEAIVCYRRAIRMAPESPQAYKKLGDALIRRGEWREGVDYLQRGQELNSKMSLRGKVNSPAAISPASVSGNVSSSPEQRMIAHYMQKAIENPDSAAIQADLGSLYAQQQEWNQAIACYKKALTLDKTIVQVHRNLAKVFSNVGKETEASDSWYRALRLDPEGLDGEQCLSLGNSLVKRGKAQEAIFCWQQAIRLQPSLNEAYHRLGEVLEKQENFSQAVRVYQQGLKSNASDAVCWYRLAEIYQTQKDWQKVIDCYQQLIKLKPNSSQIHNNFGNILLQLNQLEDAEKFFRRSIELNKSKVGS